MVVYAMVSILVVGVVTKIDLNDIRRPFVLRLRFNREQTIISKDLGIYRSIRNLKRCPSAESI